ncbi:hypothetical protein [Brackiella oedipodis]|uniref:hypothetical protein n=1 Tax=Brackiella oedipodis TaxID=124225 RepID=UPI00056ED327|nr:hypothetical protein [Brackiella oedipodis]
MRLLKKLLQRPIVTILLLSLVLWVFINNVLIAFIMALLFVVLLGMVVALIELKRQPKKPNNKL